VDASEIESLERDTVAAVAPPEVIEFGGWLIPFDEATIIRAKTAVPLRHDLGPEALDEVEAAYRERGLAPGFRIADTPGLEAVRADLARRGFTPGKSALLKTGDVAAVAAFSDAPAGILPKPDDAWRAVFSSKGFDPADAALRLARLGVLSGAAYGAAGRDGETHAVGLLSVGERWAGIHGMRTAQDHRGRGYASAILAALGREAAARGFEKLALDVEAANPARRIYRQAGFRRIWTYHHWRRASA
jgi:GNAT superfamily N-acetyltransferase